MNDKPKAPKLKIRNLGDEVGRSGTTLANGFITQEEYNTKLTGLNGRRIYDIMRRSDGTVHAALQTCKLPILAIDYDIEPASTDEKDDYIARFVKHELFERNINWTAFIRECLTMFDFGFSVFEKVYGMTTFENNVQIGLEKLASRKQRTIQSWRLDDGTPGVQQQLNGTSDNVTGLAEIPMEKLVVFTNEKEGENHEGISLLRFAYKDWDMKDKLGLINAIGLEKMSVGVPVLSTPSNASIADKEKARESLRQFRANEEGYIELPNDSDGWSVEMLDMKAGSTKNALPTIQYHDRQILLSVLAQFLNLGSEGASGSRAVSTDHSSLFLLSEEAAVKNIVDTIQEQLIKQLCDLNFTDMPNGYPKLKSGRVADDDISNLATAVNSLMSAGALTYDPNLEQWARRGLHAPELPTDDNGDPIAPEKPEPVTPPTQKPTNNVDETIKQDPSLDPNTKASLRAAARIRDQLVDSLR